MWFISVIFGWNCLNGFYLQFVEYMVRNLKDSLKSCKWNPARYSLRFLADLVNCHVISAGTLLQLLDNMVDAAKEDGVPQVKYVNTHVCIVQVVLFCKTFFLLRNTGPYRVLPLHHTGSQGLVCVCSAVNFTVGRTRIIWEEGTSTWTSSGVHWGISWKKK